MVSAEIIDWRDLRTLPPLVRAFAISVLLHLLLFSGLEVGNRFDLWQFSPLVVLGRLVEPHALPETEVDRATARAIQIQREAETEEIPIIFVDVDPTQASAEAPADTKYYSPVNSLAANRDTSQGSATPQIDGTQTEVLKTMDSDRARLDPKPLQPAPVVPQQPEAGVEPKPIPPQAVSARPAEPAPAAPSPAAAEDAPAPRGETLMAKANPTPLRPPGQTAPAIEMPPPRPRTVAAALAQRQLNPNSALVGRKMRQDGGVRRFSISSSLDVQGSPLGSYDARFIAAVQQCWYQLLEEQRYSLDRVGKVVINFRLTEDGRISDLHTAESSVGEIYTTLCELAITRPQPYERWPNDVWKMVGASYRDVRFTFHY